MDEIILVINNKRIMYREYGWVLPLLKIKMKIANESGDGHLCLISLNLFLSLSVGVAGVDRQDQ